MAWSRDRLRSEVVSWFPNQSWGFHETVANVLNTDAWKNDEGGYRRNADRLNGLFDAFAQAGIPPSTDTMSRWLNEYQDRDVTPQIVDRVKNVLSATGDPSDPKVAMAAYDKVMALQPNNPSAFQALKAVGMRAINGMVDRDINKAVDAAAALARNGQPVDAAGINNVMGAFKDRDIDPQLADRRIQLAQYMGQEAFTQVDRDINKSWDSKTAMENKGQPVTKEGLAGMNAQYANTDVNIGGAERRLDLGNLGYDTSKMVERTVDQKTDVGTALGQAGTPVTQGNIEQYAGGASANGTKDVNVGATAAKIGATNTLIAAAGGGNLGGGTGPTGTPSPAAPGVGNLGTGPGSATAGSGFNTGQGQTTDAVSKDYAKTAMDNLDAFFPGFKARQVELGKFADTLTADLNSGAIPEGLKRGFQESIRSAQGVRGLGASPLAAFDEAIGMSGAVQRYQTGQLGNLSTTTDIMGKPLNAPGGYSDVQNLGQNLVASGQRDRQLDQNQQQINLGAASDVLDRAEFTEGMDAERNKPKPSFWENLGYAAVGGVTNSLGAGLAKKVVF